MVNIRDTAQRLERIEIPENTLVTLDEMKEILGNCYASFAPETSNTAMGNALNDSQFSFECRRVGTGKEYKLIEK